MENTVTLQPLARNISVFYEINLTHYTVLKYKLCLKFVFYKIHFSSFRYLGIVLNNVLSWISLTDHYFPWLHSLVLLNRNEIKSKKELKWQLYLSSLKLEHTLPPSPSITTMDPSLKVILAMFCLILPA